MKNKEDEVSNKYPFGRQKVQAITNEISSMSGFPHDSTQLTFVAALQVYVRMVHASYDQVLK